MNHEFYTQSSASTSILGENLLSVLGLGKLIAERQVQPHFLYTHTHTSDFIFIHILLQPALKTFKMLITSANDGFYLKHYGFCGR